MSWGIVAAVGGTVAGSLIMGEANKDAARTQARSADEAVQLQADMFNQSRSDAEPWREIGGDAINRLQRVLGLDGKGGTNLTSRINVANVQAEPGYQFGLQQGEQAITRAAAAQGRNLSGATLKALNRYSQDYAGQQYGNAFNREIANRQQQLNPLLAVAGFGQTANAQSQQAGQAYATNAGNALMQAGNARAAAGVANAGNWANAVNQGLAGWMRYGGQQASPAVNSNANAWQGFGGNASDQWYG